MSTQKAPARSPVNVAKAEPSSLLLLALTTSSFCPSARAAASAVLTLAGLLGMDQVTNGLVCVFGISLKIALETLPAIVLTAWHLLQPYAFRHWGLLESLVQVCISLQFALTLTSV